MDLSIIVPAYNEELRIENFAKSLIGYLYEKSKELTNSYEIIFVDDGSKDNTKKILDNLNEFYSQKEKIRVISYPKNKGKGHAVKKGVLNAKGDKIIFMDADGSIAPEEISKIVNKLNYYDIVIGDRSSKKSRIKQSPLRFLTGTIFSLIANILFPIKTRDTLCGFKGFKKDAAYILFNELKSLGWIFDFELIYRAQKKKYSIYKLPFNWEHKKGTKLKIYTPLIMLLELIKLRMKMINLK